MGRQHPLDVFRSSRDGFEKASRRRTVAGKVIASSVRRTDGESRAKPAPAARKPAPAPRPKPAAAPRGTGGARLFAPGPDKAKKTRKRTSGAASKAGGTTRTIFFGAIVMLSAVVLVVVFKQFWLGGGVPDLPTMKLGDVLPPGPGQALAPGGDPVDSAAPAPDVWTIRAAVYNGSDRGLELALAAHTELAVRGLPGVTLVGHETDEAGEYESFELIVGAARTAEALEGTLDRLLAIDDWPGGKAAPFVDARIVAHPMPDAVEQD